MRNIKNYFLNQDGNVALMFSGAAAVLLGLTGLAVDYSNMVRMRTELQANMDAAVLAAATVEFGNGRNTFSNKSNEEKLRLEAANNVIIANGYNLNELNPELEFTDRSVVIKAEIKYMPHFGRFIGRDEVKISAVSESGIGRLTKVDLVLVLDNTDSMSIEGKMDALKTGAIGLVEAIEEDGYGSKIGLVPFSRYVRINETMATQSWFHRPVEYETTRTEQDQIKTGGTCYTEEIERDGVKTGDTYEKCENQTVTLGPEYEKTYESRWEGCVGTRSHPLNETDGSYHNRVPGILNFVPRENHAGNHDVWTRCPAEMIGLTDNYSLLKNEIKDLYTTDNTYLPAGLIWGERVLSPALPFDNAQEDSGNPNKRVMVFMTDGENTSRLESDAYRISILDGPPYINGLNNNDLADGRADATDQATARLCSKIKADGTDIFTIAFKVTDPATKQLLTNCASSPDMALTADDNRNLIAQFEVIAESLSESVRLFR